MPPHHGMDGNCGGYHMYHGKHVEVIDLMDADPPADTYCRIVSVGSELSDDLGHLYDSMGQDDIDASESPADPDQTDKIEQIRFENLPSPAISDPSNHKMGSGFVDPKAESGSDESYDSIEIVRGNNVSDADQSIDNIEPTGVDATAQSDENDGAEGVVPGSPGIPGDSIQKVNSGSPPSVASSNDYEGVYYGSSSDDDDPNNPPNIPENLLEDIPEPDADAEPDVNAILQEIGEPDENEEPYDILADNGEFDYSEEDQRLYRSLTPVMIPISEEEEHEEENGEENSGTSTLPSNPKPTSRTSRAGAATNLSLQQLDPPSSNAPMYQMPQYYNVPSPNAYNGDDEDESKMDESQVSVSSSRVSGSIKRRVRDIDNVLDSMTPDDGKNGSDDSNINEAPTFDDTTIMSDVSAGATTRLSDELDKVYMDFTGIDMTNRRVDNKPKTTKKKTTTNLKTLPTLGNSSEPPEEKKRRGIRLVWIVLAVVLLVTLLLYLVFRLSTDQTETSASANVQDDLSTSPVTTTLPTLSPVAIPDAAANRPSSSSSAIGTGNTKMPSLKPSYALAGMSSVHPSTIPKPSYVSSGAPSVHPSTFRGTSMTSIKPSSTSPDTPPIYPSTSTETRRPSTKPSYTLSSTPSTYPLTDISGPPSPNTASNANDFGKTQPPSFSGTIDDAKETINDSEGNQLDDVDSPSNDNSFDIPDNDSERFEDDEFQPIEPNGFDDFYTTDDTYEYELHHPNADEVKKPTKISKNAKQSKVEHSGYYTTKTFKARNKHNYYYENESSSASRPQQRYWQLIPEPIEENQPHIVTVQNQKHHHHRHENQYQQRYNYQQQFASGRDDRPVPKIIVDSAKRIRKEPYG